MAQAFYGEYVQLFGEDSIYDDVEKQFVFMENTLWMKRAVCYIMIGMRQSGVAIEVGKEVDWGNCPEV